jgi:hypothetical protein
MERTIWRQVHSFISWMGMGVHGVPLESQLTTLRSTRLSLMRRDSAIEPIELYCLAIAVLPKQMEEWRLLSLQWPIADDDVKPLREQLRSGPNQTTRFGSSQLAHGSP